jgi:hypothetical protein
MPQHCYWQSNELNAYAHQQLHLICRPLKPYILRATCRTYQCACRLQEEGLSVLGAFPEDAMLRAVRLDELLPALEAQQMFGSNVTLDQVRGLFLYNAHCGSSIHVAEKGWVGKVGYMCVM